MRFHPLAGRLLTLALALGAVLGCIRGVTADTRPHGEEASAPRSIVLASTTSTDNSGLYDVLLPAFTRDTGIVVRVIAVGTGRALSIASRGDADVLIVHDAASELEFVRAGYGVERKTFMYNDYVLVGPIAAAVEAGGVSETLRRIAQSGATFVSRGDDSGTHKKELSLWYEVLGGAPSGRIWYREVGAGMGTALNIANELGAYTLADRSTWVSFNNRANLKVIVENEPPLHNPYSVILVNPGRYPGVRFAAARVFSDWLTSERGFVHIRGFKVRGRQLFFPYLPRT